MTGKLTEFNNEIKKELGVIDEKWINGLCISNDCEDPNVWKIEASEDGLSELLRLARVGLKAEDEGLFALRDMRMRNKELAEWAEKHALLALGGAKAALFVDATVRQVKRAEEMVDAAIAAYPAPKEPLVEDEAQ